MTKYDPIPLTGHDPAALRAAFGSFMTGVAVVTATDKKGAPVGFTANSFTSVSMDPPLVLVCPGNHLSSYADFERVQHFAINILAEDQAEVSNLFASKTADRFAQVDWKAGMNGAPLITGAAARFSCSTFQRVPAGDHLILIGHVDAFDHSGRSGLGYATGGYFTLGQTQR